MMPKRLIQPEGGAPPGENAPAFGGTTRWSDHSNGERRDHRLGGALGDGCDRHDRVEAESRRNHRTVGNEETRVAVHLAGRRYDGGGGIVTHSAPPRGCTVMMRRKTLQVNRAANVPP